MTLKTLSPTMQETLDKAREAGHLERWRGGFWTVPGSSYKVVSQLNGTYRVPDWWVSAGTVSALINRGLLRGVREPGLSYITRAEVIS